MTEWERHMPVGDTEPARRLKSALEKPRGRGDRANCSHTPREIV
jgi:hypothetical protein